MPWPGERDTELFELLDRELERQNTTLQLIASENFTSPAVLEATGSVLTNKYTEGYPGKRYYGGNVFIDEVEDLARDRAKELFGAEHANVQPHSGANANIAVYLAMLEPGDKVMGMSLDHGGHLTHGSPVNVSGRLYDFVAYGVTPSDERLDYDQIRDRALRERPKMIIAGATAYPRIIDPGAAARDRRRGRRAVDVRRRAHRGLDRRWRASESGSVRRHRHLHHAQDVARAAWRLHPLPKRARAGDRQGDVPRSAGRSARTRHRGQGGRVPRSDGSDVQGLRAADRPNAQSLAGALAGEGFRLVSGGTDNHLMLVDLRQFDDELTGKEAQAVLDRAGITLNKNTIPDDPRSPFVTSGVRIGTPAVTTQGMTEPEMAQIAELIARALRMRTDDAELAEVRRDVATLCSAFTPVFDLSRSPS